MPRDFSDPWEPEDVFDRAEAADRRARIEASREANAARLEQEEIQNAQRKIKADALTIRARDSVLIHEYASQGLTPPFTNGEGVPTVSLALLRQMGWTVEEEFGGRRVLVKPCP